MFDSLEAYECTPSEQLRQFTNRSSEQDVFRRVWEIKSEDTLPALMFYGIAGTGKSWLLERFRQTSQNYGLPTAILALDSRTGGALGPRDPAGILAEIRCQLGVSLRCPRFDLAYEWLRAKQGIARDPAFRGGTALGVLGGFVGQLVQLAVDGIWGAKNVVRVLGILFRPITKILYASGVMDWLAEKNGEDDYLRLKVCRPGDIYEELHTRLLLDLGESLRDRGGYRCRGVVLIDTMESLASTTSADHAAYHAQQWVRDLYHPDSPLLLVMAGRDCLTWGQVGDSPFADRRHLEQHLIGGLAQPDAEGFLRNCGISDHTLQHAILTVSRDERTEPQQEADSDHVPQVGYHPFVLGLCADTVWNETQRGQTLDAETFNLPAGDIEQLARRFLRSMADDRGYEFWLKKLAITPRFDERAARRAFSDYYGAVVDVSWSTLMRYSFVRKANTPGWLRLHPRMQSALNALQQQESSAKESPWQHGNEWWKQYWSSRAESDIDDFAGLAWHHHYELDAESALDVWNKLAERERSALRLQNHYRLLSWGAAVRPTGDVKTQPEAQALQNIAYEFSSASIGNRTDNLVQAIDAYERTLHFFTEVDFPGQWATTQNSLGVAFAGLPTGDRAENLQRAIDCYERALRIRTEAEFPGNWAATLNNLGGAYCKLPSGDQAENLRKAIDCFERSFRIRTEADFPTQWAATQNNLGNVYAHLPAGDRAKNIQKAIDCFVDSLRVYTEADFPFDWAMTQYNLGNAIFEMPAGDRAENLQKVIDCYEGVFRIFTEADLPMDWPMTQCRLALAKDDLQRLSS